MFHNFTRLYDLEPNQKIGWCLALNLFLKNASKYNGNNEQVPLYIKGTCFN
jgi:hypothetical protein